LLLNHFTRPVSRLLMMLLLLLSSVTLIAVSFLIEYLCNVFKLI
jgi:hypothetical protein